jgi:hypothetical protein
MPSRRRLPTRRPFPLRPSTAPGPLLSAVADSVSPVRPFYLSCSPLILGSLACHRLPTRRPFPLRPSTAPGPLLSAVADSVSPVRPFYLSCSPLILDL